MNPKRVALWCLIGSVVLSAFFGILSIVGGTFGDLQIRVLLTTLTISGASICAMSCGALWERQRAQLVAPMGIVLAVTTAIFLIVGIWLHDLGVNYWKFTMSLAFLAIATSHVSLISLAKLAARFNWNRIAAFISSYLLALLLIYLVWSEAHSEQEVLLRVIGVDSIVLAALTILTPIFHRLSSNDLSESTAMAALPATITCPACGASVPNTFDVISCERCECKFQVTILDEGRIHRRQEQS